jgi:predicted ATPase/DNA-binding SARP family transcriptional activator
MQGIFMTNNKESSRQVANNQTMQDQCPASPLLSPQNAVIELRLFGSFLLIVSGKEVSAISRPAKLLLALLMLHHDAPLKREMLAAHIWNDAPQDRALFYLRRTLTELRTALGTERERIVSASDGTLRFETAGLFCDLTAFEWLAAQPDEASLEQAAGLYRGVLLADFDGADWLTTERERLATRFMDIEETLADWQGRRGAFSDAVQRLRRVLECDPLREPIHCRIMEILGRTGDWAGVERQFRELRRVLHSELNMEPSAETLQIYHSLKSRANAAPATPIPPPTPLLRRLPCPLTSLVGRDAEVCDIAQALETARLVTLLGPGGVGKTRLSIAVAEEIAPQFVHGVWFADLTPVQNETSLPQTLLAALDFRFEGDGESLDVLCRVLSRKRLLLILDNAEHLRDACARLTSRLLQTCPFLTLLCTSREPLGIAGEVIRPVEPLAVPPEFADQSLLSAEELAAYDSVSLLLARIGSASPGFHLTPRNAVAIAQICRRLDGLPLALELAAARFRSLSAPEIAARLDDQFHLLTGGDPSLPRHRTLRATLDWSYNLLDDAERRLLRCVSLFAGGWTLAAAEAVCETQNGDTLSLLTSLVDKSLVVAEERNAETRYRLLEMTRAYAQERLEPEERAEFLARHAAFFLHIAQQAEAKIQDYNVSGLRESLLPESENFRLAHAWWQMRDADTALWLELFLYNTVVWQAHSHREWIARMLTEESTGTELQVRSLCFAALSAMWLNDPATETLIHRAIAAAQECGNLQWEMHTWTILAEWAQDNGQYSEALSSVEKALVLSERLNSSFHATLQARAVLILTRIGETDAAKQRLNALLAQGRRTREWFVLYPALSARGEIALQEHDYVRAQTCYREVLHLIEQHQPFVVPEIWRVLGNVAREQQEWQEAEHCYGQAIATSRVQNRRDREAWTHLSAAEVEFRQNHLREALKRLHSAFVLFEELDEPRTMALCFSRAANYHFALGEPEIAAVLWSSVEQAYREQTFAGLASEHADLEELKTALNQIMSAVEFTLLSERGAAMSLVEAAEYVFQ